MEMENHKGVLDKEYESLITQFTKELERLQVKHNQDMEKKVTHMYPGSVTAGHRGVL